MIHAPPPSAVDGDDLADAVDVALHEVPAQARREA